MKKFKKRDLEVSRFNTSKVIDKLTGYSVCWFLDGLVDGNQFPIDRNEKLENAQFAAESCKAYFYLLDLMDKLKDENGVTTIGKILEQQFPELVEYLNSEL